MKMHLTSANYENSFANERNEAENLRETKEKYGYNWLLMDAPDGI